MPAAPPPAPVARWLALGTAAGAAIALAMEYFAKSGPWQDIALLLILLALFAIVAFVHSAGQREREFRATHERVRRGESAIGELKREIDRHTELERQLLQAKQAAESAVMAKGEFLATMSHEIRTPLNGIVPMLDLLVNAPLAADHRELVRTALASSQHLLRIVDDILDYSKLEAEKLELETTTFNLRELLETVIQMMERSAESKGLRLHLRIDPAVRLPVRGDPVRLRQVLSNLVSNAIKFTERGSVTVNVARLGETPSQHRLRFEVRDTGIGIGPQAQARLFTAFSQADASTTRLYGGTGLGLAICRRIVELMGGEIGIDSEPGRGSSFHFEIPLLKVQGDMPAQEARFEGARLLLLTADDRIRVRLSMLLPNWGLRVTAVETTQEALDRLRAAASQGAPWTYDIVLADLATVRNTALALFRNLERHAIYGDVRLVCLRGDEPVPEELLRAASLVSRQAPDADLRQALTLAAAPPPSQSPGPAETASPQPGPDAADADGRPAAMPSLANARVLLVEDNPVNLMVGQRLLSVLGVDCDTAQNGEAALLRMQASRYDIVLMDCQMPVMDGYTATRRWREAEHEARSTHLPIIAMTANAMAGDRQKCLDAGMDDYLPKPVTRVELERCLHRWWRPRQGGTAGAQPRPDLTPLDIAGASPNAPAPSGAQATRPPTGPSPASPPPLRPLPASPAPARPPAATRPPAPPPSRQPGPTLRTDGGAVPGAMRAFADLGRDHGGSPAMDPPAPARDPVLDLGTLDELRQVLGDEVDRLVQVFLDTAPNLVDRLELAAEGFDYEALRDAAHSLKSSSANLGAMALSNAAKRIELGARTRSLDRPAVSVALLAQEFGRAREALADWRTAAKTRRAGGLPV